MCVQINHVEMHEDKLRMASVCFTDSLLCRLKEESGSSLIPLRFLPVVFLEVLLMKMYNGLFWGVLCV